MTKKSAKRRRKKATISEQDVASLLLRFAPETVLSVLSEISKCTEEEKIDWNALAENTSSGVSSAREYQMLWRHLAYGDPLLENLDDNAELLGDESDLEVELEATPSVDCEASAEAAACVKVLIASSPPNDENLDGSIIEAPLTINIPSFESCRDSEEPSCSTEGKNVMFPVYVPLSKEKKEREPLSKGKKEKKPWSKEEDLELVAAVQKCGVGNWTEMLREEFKGDKTTGQLAQRWGTIRQRYVDSNPGSDSIRPQLSKSQLATSCALSAALDKPLSNFALNTIDQAESSTDSTNGTDTSSLAAAASETSTSEYKSIKSQLQSQSDNQKPAQENQTMKPSPTGSLCPAQKSGAHAMKSIPNPTLMLNPTRKSSDDLIRATAVASGWRIAHSSHAESLLKAAQSKNAVHIIPSLIKSSGPVNFPSPCYISTGLARNIPVKSDQPPVEPCQTTSADVPAKQNTDVSSSKETKTTEATPVQYNDVASSVSVESEKSVNGNQVSGSQPQECETVADVEVEKNGQKQC